MATKLKNMRLTSVDLVRAGANQEADICLFKSADPQEATDSPTVAEKNIFKRFIGWLHENQQEAEMEPETEPETGIEKADEDPEPSDIFKSAIIESILSIIADDSLSADEKNSMIEKSVGQYHDKMLELAKSEGSESYDYFFEDLEKANPYHAADGKFTTAAGSGGGSASSGAKFDAKAAEDKLKLIGRKRNNGGAKRDDYKVLGEILHSAPVGTVCTETGDRGAKFQYIKTKAGTSKMDDEWEGGGYKSNSHIRSMTWGGPSGGSFEFKFDTPDTAPTRDEVRDSQMNAVNGQLRQWLGGKSDRYDEIEEV